MLVLCVKDDGGKNGNKGTEMGGQWAEWNERTML
jgi:hypothetical protein